MISVRQLERLVLLLFLVAVIFAAGEEGETEEPGPPGEPTAFPQATPFGSSANTYNPLPTPTILTSSVSMSRWTDPSRIFSTQKALLSVDKTSSVTSSSSVKLSGNPVISASAAGKSSSTWIHMSSVVPTTPPVKGPTAPPQNVTARHLTSQSILVSWRVPPSGTLNGKLVHYDVLVRKKNKIPTTHTLSTQTVVRATHSLQTTPSAAPATESPTEAPDERSLEREISAGLNLNITIDSLEKWTEYNVQVRAVTKHGDGPYSAAVTVRTDEDVPGAPQNLMAITINSSAVFVNWTEPLAKNGILQKYQVSYSINGSEPVLEISTGLETSLVLSGLKANSRYTIHVVAFTRKGHGPEKEVSAVTAQGKPSAPRYVTARSINSTAVQVSWAPPELPNGDIKYVVSYEPRSDEGPFDVTNTKLIISGLEEFVQYNFTVVAINVNHEHLVSPPAFATAVTDEAAPTGAPRDVSAVTNSSSAIWLSWVPPQKSDRNGIITSYVVKYYVSSLPNGQQFRNTTDNRTTLLIGGLRSFQEYRFTVQAVNRAGISPESEPVANKTLEDAPSPPVNLSVGPINATAIRVEWEPPLNPNGIVKYRLYIRLSREDPGANRPVYDGEGFVRVVSRLEEFTMYTLTLVAYNAKHGWNSSVVIHEFKTRPGKPTGPPQNVTVVANSSESILVSWDPPRLADRNGHITRYIVTYIASNGAGNQSTDGNTTCLLVQRLQKYEEYNFTVRAVNQKGAGPASDPVSTMTLQDVPGVPMIESVRNVSSTVFQVTWRQPFDANGIIILYRLCWKREGSADAKRVCHEVSAMEYNITNLVPYSSYSLSLAAKTSVGFGPYTTQRHRTDEGVPPTIGTLATPSSPDWMTFDIELQKVPNTNGAISYYQVVVKELPTDSKDQPVPPDKRPQAYEPQDLLTYEEAQERKPTLVPYIAAQFAASEFDSHRLFTVGDKRRWSASSARRRRRGDSKVVYYNGPLDPSTYYTVFQRAYINEDLYSSSEWMKAVQTGGVGTTAPPSPSRVDVGLVAGLSVFIVILVVVMIVSFWILRKKRSKFGSSPLDGRQSHVDNGQPLKKLSRKRRSQQKRLMGSTDSLDTLNDLAAQRARRVPIPAIEFEGHAERMHMDGDHGFSEEYSLVEPDEEYQYQAFLNPANKFKNRYANIVAYDHSRVLLSPIDGVPGSDYINANYIDGYQQEKAFIATQGPLYETFDDFWRMVWETHSHVIVMLTRLEERGRSKCDQYWPDTDMQTYGRVEVTVSEILHMSHFTLRTFLVTNKQYPEEERIVKQFHYTTWPDHDVPSHPTPLLSLLRRASSANLNPDDPMIVHCSAGVGRTGTFITLDVMLKRIAHDEPIDIFGFVRQMRTQRNIMVQTEAQYVFIHDALQEAINCGMTEVEAKDLRARIRELYIEDETGCTNMEKEFGRLAKEESHPLAFKNASMSCNSTKNRYCNILPFDSSRVRLRMRPGDLGSDYINASAVDGYCQPKAYIATQAPLPNTYEDFWRLVWEQHSASIVMLTREEEGGKVRCHHYWPSDGARQYGEILVELVEEASYSDYTTRKFKLTQTELKDTRTIRQFQYVDWPDNGMPDSGVGLVDLIGQVQKWQQQSGNNAIVVHCSGGVGRTGVFCAMSVMIERLKAEGLIDVFQTVQAMRLQRPAMVQTKDQYEFCYTALQEYLDSFDLHANFQ